MSLVSIKNVKRNEYRFFMLHNKSRRKKQINFVIEDISQEQTTNNKLTPIFSKIAALCKSLNSSRCKQKWKNCDIN